MNRIHWLTVASLATCAVLLTILFHESIHALVCVLLGGEVRSFSAVHVSCQCDSSANSKLVAGSASIANLILAAGLWPLLRRVGQSDGRLVFFIWLLFSMNLFTGAGYWFGSGMVGAGDWAVVIDGWQPRWLYQIGLVILGGVGLLAAVGWSLVEFARLLDRDDEKPIGRAQIVAMVCYAASFVAVFILGLAQPGGPFSLPSIASMIGVLGGLSPLLWMMQWFRAEMFKLRGSRPLVIEPSSWITALAVIAVLAATWLTIIGQRGT